MIGTLINVLSIIFFSAIGLLVGSKINDELRNYLMRVLGLVVFVIGLDMALETSNFAMVTLTVLVGSAIGSVARIEERLEDFGMRVERRFEGSRFAEGFVTATILYCVGSMAVLGPIQEALTGDISILLTKAMLDGIASLALSSTLGIGVAFSSIPVLAYQSIFYFGALVMKDLATDLIVRELTASGGVLISAIGLNLMKILNLKPGNMLPSLVVLPLMIQLFSLLAIVLP